MPLHTRTLAVFSASALVSLFALAPPASAVTIASTPIGNPGNTCDGQIQGCFGAVGYAYSIGTYEVTNAQYADFLNAKAASDPVGLYNASMGSGLGGIAQTGSPGSYSYSAIAGRANLPVNYVSFYDALRFANWLANGQGSGDTETGSYTLLGGAAVPTNGATVTRNAGATIVLTSEDEWYKAAYYDALSTSYFAYPAGSNATTACTAPTAAANSANCDAVSTPIDLDALDADVDDLTAVGSFTGSASPYGTFDQGGNVFEWNETIIGTDRGRRGGSFDNFDSNLAAATRSFFDPAGELGNLGFRVALVPEPGTGFLVMVGLLRLAAHRRQQISH
jgi:formylglycine-generating enzyme required for sulfatase activity